MTMRHAPSPLVHVCAPAAMPRRCPRWTLAVLLGSACVIAACGRSAEPKPSEPPADTTTATTSEDPMAAKHVRFERHHLHQMVPGGIDGWSIHPLPYQGDPMAEHMPASVKVAYDRGGAGPRIELRISDSFSPALHLAPTAESAEVATDSGSQRVARVGKRFAYEVVDRQQVTWRVLLANGLTVSLSGHVTQRAEVAAAFATIDFDSMDAVQRPKVASKRGEE